VVGVVVAAQEENLERHLIVCRSGYAFFSTAALEGESRRVVLVSRRNTEKWCILESISSTFKKTPFNVFENVLSPKNVFEVDSGEHHFSAFLVEASTMRRLSPSEAAVAKKMLL
jgi:hypothetical protein